MKTSSFRIYFFTFLFSCWKRCKFRHFTGNLFFPSTPLEYQHHFFRRNYQFNKCPNIFAVNISVPFRMVIKKRWLIIWLLVFSSTTQISMLKISNLLENDGISSPPVRRPNVREIILVWHLFKCCRFFYADAAPAKRNFYFICLYTAPAAPCDDNNRVWAIILWVAKNHIICESDALCVYARDACVWKSFFNFVVIFLSRILHIHLMGCILCCVFGWESCISTITLFDSMSDRATHTHHNIAHNE